MSQGRKTTSFKLRTRKRKKRNKPSMLKNFVVRCLRVWNPSRACSRTLSRRTARIARGWFSWKGSPITRIAWLQAACDCCSIFLSVCYMLILKVRGVRLLEECALTAQLGKNCENIITFLGREFFPHLGATITVLNRPQAPAMDLCALTSPLARWMRGVRSSSFVRLSKLFSIGMPTVWCTPTLSQRTYWLKWRQAGQYWLIDFWNSFRPERLVRFLDRAGKLQNKRAIYPRNLIKGRV